MKNVKTRWSQGRIILWQIIKVPQGYVHYDVVQVHGHWDKHIIAPVPERNIRHQTGTKPLPELMMAYVPSPQKVNLVQVGFLVLIL